jgi:putative transposase
MSAYRQILYQLIFRTKGSEKVLSQEHSAHLYKYMWGIINNKGCVLYRINGVEDHIHILSDLHPTIALSDYIRELKVGSSKWMKSSGYFPQFTGWGTKYAALTYSYKEKEILVNYIKNQQEHHKKETFQEEIKRLFIENNIEAEEKWFWVDN